MTTKRIYINPDTSIEIRVVHDDFEACASEWTLQTYPKKLLLHYNKSGDIVIGDPMINVFNGANQQLLSNVRLQAQLAAANERVKALEGVLCHFLEDERFHVAVGGNPIAVEKMIAEARAALNAGGGDVHS